MGQEMKQVADRLVIKVCHGCGEPMGGSGHHAHGGKLSPHREEEVVSQRAHEAEVDATAQRAIQIYIASTAEASGSEPERLDSDDDVWTLADGDRATTIASYAAEFGIDFAEVRCTRRWMRVDFAAIADTAADLATNPADYGEAPIAYTWPDEGWTYEDCKPDTPGAIAMYRCEIKRADQPKEEER